MLLLYVIVSICVDDHSTFSISIPISQSVRCEGSETKQKAHNVGMCQKAKNSNWIIIKINHVTMSNTSRPISLHKNPSKPQPFTNLNWEF